MIVYRLEDTSAKSKFSNVGCGVYSNSSLGYQFCSDLCDSSHPNPLYEPRLGDFFSEGWVCCFASLKELHRWFDLIEKAYHEFVLRARIATYVVDDSDFHQGRWQAIAKASSMTLVEEHTPYYGLGHPHI